MKRLIRFTLGVAAILAMVVMMPAAAYAVHERVTLAPGGSSTTQTTVPSSTTVTNTSGNGSATFGTHGNSGTANNPPSGTSGGLSTPPSPGTPPQTSTVDELVPQPTGGPPPATTCWLQTTTGAPFVINGPAPAGDVGYTVAVECWPAKVQCELNPNQSFCSHAPPLLCPPGTTPAGGSGPTGEIITCNGPKTPGTNPTPGYHTSWTIGVPGDGGTVCVTAWKIVFQNNPQTFTDGGNCYTSPPTINFKYTCNVQPTYSVYARVTAPGGGSVTVSAHYSSGGYTYTLPAQSFPQWFLVSSGTMPGPSSCPNSTWNSPPSGIKVTTSISAPQGGFLPNGDIQALGKPIHIDYTPTLYGGHLKLNTGVSCASPTTDTYYDNWLWVTGGGHTSLQYQRASNGKMYHLIDGMSVLPYNASITGDGTADGGQACQATLHIHGPTPPGAPYIVQAIPQFTYTYGILHINLTTSFAGLVAVSQQVTGSGVFLEQVPCTKHVDKNGHKTTIHTTCPQDVTRTNSITFFALQSSTVSSAFSQTTNTHTVTVHSPQVNQNTFNAERPYIKSQSY